MVRRRSSQGPGRIQDPSSGPRRRGRPATPESTREALRLSVSQQAVRLFARRGVAGTTVDQIAAEGGISTRTFWRLFPTKQDSIRPLASDGVRAMSRMLIEAAPGEQISGIRTVDEVSRTPTESERLSTTGLLRLILDDDGLQTAWFQVMREAELTFAASLAHRTGAPATSLQTRVEAAMLTAALRAALEYVAIERRDTLDDADLRAAVDVALAHLPF